MNTWAATASTPIAAVRRGPANAAVIAGAATSRGPRWMSGGARASMAQTATMIPTGISTRTRLSSRRPRSCLGHAKGMLHGGTGAGGMPGSSRYRDRSAASCRMAAMSRSSVGSTAEPP